MAWREARVWHRLKRTGTEFAATGEVTTSENLASLTNVATFSPSARPALAANNAITIEWIDVAAGITRYQFVGTIADVDTESQPQATNVPARGPLAKLEFVRKVSDGDLLLTGMTDQEVVRAVLTYCGISHTSGDIQGANYVLGELAESDSPSDPANLWWRVDEPGSKIIGELDDILGFKTFEVANARIVRRFYDLAPDGTGVYRNYTKGVSRDLWSAHRTVGKPDTVQNAWDVTGPTIKCGPGLACTCTPWAKARDTNPQSGSLRRRRPTRTLQTDILQSEDALVWKVERLMRFFNRLTDELSFSALNDVNVHQTSVVKLVDSTPYIDCGLGCNATVTAVERTGSQMAVTATTGEPGETGTVTSGVEMLCNDVESDGDMPGIPPTPDVDFPPIDPGTEFDPGDLPELPDWEELPPIEPPEDPEAPDPTETFSGCTTAGSLVCPEGDDAPDTCDASDVTPGCTLVGIDEPPADVCNVEGWHGDTYTVSDDSTYFCNCEIDSNIVHAGGAFTDKNYFVTAAGKVERVTTCYQAPDTVAGDIRFYLGDAVDHAQNDAGPTYTLARSYGLSACVEFDFKFCTESDEIVVNLLPLDADGDAFVIGHAMTIYATPGGTNVDFGGGLTRSTNSDISKATLSGDLAPHHSLSLSNRNSGGIDLGPGLALNTEYHGQLCVEGDGGRPRTMWNNGVNSGYEQHLPYINEANPLPGEPTDDPESADHVDHIVQFILRNGHSQSCTEECPGPQIWGVVTGSETCVENETFVWPEGDTG